MAPVPRLLIVCTSLTIASLGGGRCADVAWKAEVGFDGAFTQGAWTPVSVELHNSGASQEGRVLIPMREHEYDPSTTLYTVPVQLPEGTHKLYQLYVPSPRYNQPVRVELKSFTETRELHDMRLVDPADMLVVVLGGNASLLGFLQGARAPTVEIAAASLPAYLPGMSPPGSSSSATPQVELARSVWGRLPESWLGWDGVDAVVLTDAQFGAASEREVKALAQWVRLGGVLIVPGGAQSAGMAAGPLGELLPMQVSGTRTVPNVVALEAWAGQAIAPSGALIAQGALRPGAEVLLGSEQTPLIVAREVEAGRVVMTTFDFTAEPVKYWDGQPALWERLLAGGASGTTPLGLLTQARGAARDYYGYGPSAAGTAAHSRGSALPPLWIMVGFLVTYIIVVVPGNYFLVTRLRKRELAWLTTPAIVIVFFAGAYGMGLALRGSHTLLNRLAVIELHPGQATARSVAWVGIFSPARTTYDVALEGSAAAAADTGDSGSEAFSVIYGPTPKVTGLAVNMWSTRVIQVEFLAELGGSISGHVAYDGTDFRAHVRNDTGVRLAKIGIVREGRMGEGVALERGAEADLSFIRTSALTLPRGGEGASLGERALADLLGTGSGGYRPSLPPGMQRQASRPRIVALCTEPLVPVSLAGLSPATDDAAVIEVDLPVRLSTGAEIKVPDWLVSHRVIATEGTVRGTSEYGGYLTIEQGSVTLEFTVPLSERGGAAKGLLVGTTINAPPTVSPTAVVGVVKLYGYNWARDRWVELNYAGATAALPHPEQCMTADGRVRVKIKAPTGSVTLQDVSLTARIDTH
ncbi:MAG: hypothetical protein AB7Y46_01210 [Armatimonadota bacterium]